MGYPYQKEEFRNLTSRHLQKGNLKWVVYLNVWVTTLKLLDEKVGKNLYDLGSGRVLRHDTKNRSGKKSIYYTSWQWKHFTLSKIPLRKK